MRSIRASTPLDDGDVVEACRQGDPEALGAVFRAHSPYLERVLARIGGPKEDLEDWLQLTFVNAIRAFPNFRGDARVRTWLTRIAVRTALEQMRRPERRRRSPLELVEPAAPDGDEPDRARHLDARLQLERVYELLERVGPKKRVAFVLHVLEGRPIDEVAALMGASKAATKSRVFWARKELMTRAQRDPRLSELAAGPGGAR